MNSTRRCFHPRRLEMARLIVFVITAVIISASQGFHPFISISPSSSSATAWCQNLNAAFAPAATRTLQQGRFITDGRDDIFRFRRARFSQRGSSSSSSNVVLSMVAKSGGKLITSSDQYADMVLSPNAPKPVMVFFTAPWCGPCRLSIPVVQSIVKQFANQLEVVEVCTDDLADVASDSGVVSIPTIQFYHRGELLDTIVGCVARNVLATAVDKVLDDISTASDPKRLSNQTASLRRDDFVDGGE